MCIPGRLDWWIQWREVTVWLFSVFGASRWTELDGRRGPGKVSAALRPCSSQHETLRTICSNSFTSSPRTAGIILLDGVIPQKPSSHSNYLSLVVSIHPRKQLKPRVCSGKICFRSCGNHEIGEGVLLRRSPTGQFMRRSRKSGKRQHGGIDVIGKHCATATAFSPSVSPLSLSGMRDRQSLRRSDGAHITDRTLFTRSC